MAIFSNDPNQGIRDAGMEQFIPTPVSSITYKGNAGVNARRAGSYTNTPRIVSGRKKPAPTDPSQMTPEQKSAFMAKSGDSTSGKPSQRFAPYDRIRIGPGSTSTSPNESGIVPAGKKAFVPSRVLFPHEAHQPDGTHRGGRTLAQQVDGILPPVVAKPNIPSTAVLAGKTPPGVSAILGAATASTGKTQMSPEQAKFAEIRARYDRENENARARMPVEPTFREPTEEEYEARRLANDAYLTRFKKNHAIRFINSSPEEQKQMASGMSFAHLADLVDAAQIEIAKRTAAEKSSIQTESAEEQDRIAADQREYSQRDRERRMARVAFDIDANAAHNRALNVRRQIEEAGRARDLKTQSDFLEAMAESPVSKVFSRKNPFGAGVSELGRWFSSRPGMQDILPYTTE